MYMYYHYLTKKVMWQLQAAPHHCHHVYKTSTVAEMGDRGHNRHGLKGGGALCPFCGGAGSPSSTCGVDRALLPYQVAYSSTQPFGHNIHGPKTGGCAPFSGGELRPHLGQKLGGRLCRFFLGGAGSPSNTKSPVPRPTSTQSGILVHPAV